MRTLPNWKWRPAKESRKSTHRRVSVLQLLHLYGDAKLDCILRCVTERWPLTGVWFKVWLYYVREIFCQKLAAAMTLLVGHKSRVYFQKWWYGFSWFHVLWSRSWICKTPLEMSLSTKLKFTKHYKWMRLSYPFIQNDNPFCPTAKERDPYHGFLPHSAFWATFDIAVMRKVRAGKTRKQKRWIKGSCLLTPAIKSSLLLSNI